MGEMSGKRGNCSFPLLLRGKNSANPSYSAGFFHDKIKMPYSDPYEDIFDLLIKVDVGILVEERPSIVQYPINGFAAEYLVFCHY